jgi:DNA repair protein RadC
MRRIKAVYEKVGEPAAQYRTVSDAKTVFEMFQHLRQETKEHFVSIHLDVRNRVICVDEVSIGTLTNAVIHQREVYKTALLSSAASIILAHNHPSGDPTPSRDDIVVTEKLEQAGQLIGIKLLDHVIIGDTYFSMLDKGYLKGG